MAATVLAPRTTPSTINDRQTLLSLNTHFLPDNHHTMDGFRLLLQKNNTSTHDMQQIPYIKIIRVIVGVDVCIRFILMRS